ncbi:ATP-binding cassette domain-containing protein [Streptomyces peucetius]|nr:hypothetical protein CGZ69_16660 [Streptomyces peucetius subsp. caesius ATCC 27952]
MFPATATASQFVVSDVTKRYDDHVVLDRVSFTLRPGEKAGVVGDNGSGKSTLLRLLADTEQPDNGTVAVTAPGGVGHLAADLPKPIRTLSVGQRRRLELARLPAGPVDLLLLDEPTNHLSPVLVEEMEAALAQYAGTLVLVTHDRRIRAGFDGPELVLTPCR